MNRTGGRGGGSRRGIPGLWAALVLVGLAVWTMQTSSVEGQGGNSTNTFTFSTTSHTTHTRVDSFSTRITGRLANGTIVFDQTFPLPFSDAAVQQAVLDAQAALVAAAAPQVITILGPGTICIGVGGGDKTPPNCSPGQLFVVQAGTQNFNTNTHTETFIDDLFLTTQQYELAEARAIPTLSDWGQIGMAALLVLGGLLALRRRRAAM